MYIYNMPYVERMQLCKILDEQDRWEELATVHMQYDLRTINVCIYKFIYFFGTNYYYYFR